MCACGKPLHYQDFEKRKMVDDLVRMLGEFIPINGYMVPRHFVALHGVKAEELPMLAVKYGFKKKL